MRTIISIEKNTISYEEFEKIIQETKIPIQEIVIGGRKVDIEFGKRLAETLKVPIRIFKPNKNEQMVKRADTLIGIWKNADGEMKDILSRANRCGLKIMIRMVG